MALLENAKTATSSGAYDRLFGMLELGALASKIHSAVISAGNELERIIAESARNISDLDEFLEKDIMPEGVFLAHKKEIRNCRALSFPGSEPDFMVFRSRNGVRHCYIVELKDGHLFDTKKVAAESQAMRNFIERHAQNLRYKMSSHFCAFNQHDREAIRTGFKNRISPQGAMTGREFCELLEIEYDEIVERRKADGPANVTYFLEELVKIEPVRNRLNELLAG